MAVSVRRPMGCRGLRFPGRTFDLEKTSTKLAYAQSDQSLCKSLEFFLGVTPLTEHHLEVLSLKGGFTGWSESTLVKMQHCWKSHDVALFMQQHQEFIFATV